MHTWDRKSGAQIRDLSLINVSCFAYINTNPVYSAMVVIGKSDGLAEIWVGPRRVPEQEQ